MQVPESFKNFVCNMDDNQLYDLREWNSASANANRHVNAVLDEEIKKRETAKQSEAAARLLE